MDQRQLFIIIVVAVAIYLVYRQITQMKHDMMKQINTLRDEMEKKNDAMMSSIKMHTTQCISKIKHVATDNLKQFNKISELNRQPLNIRPPQFDDDYDIGSDGPRECNLGLTASPSDRIFDPPSPNKDGNSEFYMSGRTETEGIPEHEADKSSGNKSPNLELINPAVDLNNEARVEQFVEAMDQQLTLPPLVSHVEEVDPAHFAESINEHPDGPVVEDLQLETHDDREVVVETVLAPVPVATVEPVVTNGGDDDANVNADANADASVNDDANHVERLDPEQITDIEYDTYQLLHPEEQSVAPVHVETSVSEQNQDNGGDNDEDDDNNEGGSEEDVENNDDENGENDDENDVNGVDATGDDISTESDADLIDATLVADRVLATVDEEDAEETNHETAIKVEEVNQDQDQDQEKEQEQKEDEKLTEGTVIEVSGKKKVARRKRRPRKSVLSVRTAGRNNPLAAEMESYFTFETVNNSYLTVDTEESGEVDYQNMEVDDLLAINQYTVKKLRTIAHARDIATSVSENGRRRNLKKSELYKLIKDQLE